MNVIVFFLLLVWGESFMAIHAHKNILVKPHCWGKEGSVREWGLRALLLSWYHEGLFRFSQIGLLICLLVTEKKNTTEVSIQFVVEISDLHVWIKWNTRQTWTVLHSDEASSKEASWTLFTFWKHKRKQSVDLDTNQVSNWLTYPRPSSFSCLMLIRSIPSFWQILLHSNLEPIFGKGSAISS